MYRFIHDFSQISKDSIRVVGTQKCNIIQLFSVQITKDLNISWIIKIWQWLDIHEFIKLVMMTDLFLYFWQLQWQIWLWRMYDNICTYEMTILLFKQTCWFLQSKVFKIFRFIDIDKYFILMDINNHKTNYMINTKESVF